MSSTPIAEEADVPAPTEEKKAESDTIQKVKDEIRKLPELWINKPSLKALAFELLGLEALKERIDAYGLKSLIDTVLPGRARDYIYAADTVVSLLAPNTPFSKATNTFRNMALLDSLVDDITGKIELSTGMESYNIIFNVLKDVKDCPIRLNDYFIDTYNDVPMGGMFMVSLATHSVGTVVELHSKLFNRSGEESETIHCKLVYRTAMVEEDKDSYFIRSTTSHYFVVIAEILEYNLYLFMYSNTSNDRHDLTIRRIYPGSMPFYALYKYEADWQRNGMVWCRALPFSMVDFSKYVCGVSQGGIGVYKRSELVEKTSKEIFDKKTNELVKRIVHADQIGCSRSYALVGIPGTGKSFIMNKIVKDNKDAVVLIPGLPEQGWTWEFRNYLQNVIKSISNLHIYIMLDDFDKYMSDEENSGKTSQELIFFFDFLHTNCPGGFDKNGNMRKTFTLVATMNNPKTLANAIIKRSERFDEVIEIGLPQPFIYGKRLNMIKDSGDITNFESLKFRPVYWYMRRKVITLADIGNIYAIMKTHRNKECVNCTYGVRDLLYAIKFIGKNRKSASKEYAI
jgi:hypothetical protein